MATTFSARRWQLAHSEEFRLWEGRVGRLQTGLESLCTAITATGDPLTSDKELADATARRLPDCYRRCNDLEFDEIEQALAYSMLHLADRYGRVQQVLTELLDIGALPLRRTGVKVLEVGAGPAPALFATIDFYRALAEWASTVAKSDVEVDTAGGPINVGPVISPVALERGPIWDQYLHVVSELLAHTSLADPAELVYRVDHDDLIGFDQPHVHRARLDAAARRIQAEFDQDDASISWSQARQIAQDERLGGVSAYDLIVLSNMITSLDMVDKLAPDVQQLTRGLTPGGVLMILGSAGRQYDPIWQSLGKLINATPVRSLQLSTEPWKSHLEPRRAATIEAHVRGGVARLRKHCSVQAWSEIEPQLPVDLRDPHRAFTFPRFRVMAWRRRH